MHTAKSLKTKKNLYNKENKKYIYIYIYVILACILALITSLLKSWELGQYFKKNQKYFCFVLISGITNLYVKRIPDIKKRWFFYRH